MQSTESAPIRLGIIGAGWFASRRHMPEARDSQDFELAGICRRDAEARTTLANHFGVPEERCFADWTRMLDALTLDAVLIATPNNLHYSQARECLARGLHVLLEKPMSVRSSEAWELAHFAKECNKQLAVALNPPHWAHCHHMRRALASGSIGELESASIYWSGSASYVFGRAPAPDNLPGIVPPTGYRADPEQNGGGYFIDGGSHLVSELLWVTGKRAIAVSCHMDATPADMRAALTVTLENGAICSINSIGDSDYPSRRVRNVFGGSNGVITVNGFEFETTISIPDNEPRKFKEADLPPVSSPLSNLCRAIRGIESLYSPAEHGAHVVDVVEAAYESAATGATITIPIRLQTVG